MPLLIGIAVIAGAMACAHWLPRWPAPLMGAALGVVTATVLGFHGAEIGALSAGVPLYAGFSWSQQDILTVLPSAFMLALVTSVNILITSRVVEHFRGRHQRMKVADADAELGAYGIANICAGMFGAPPSVGIPARSLAAVRCGGTTRMANLLHAAILILMLRFGTGVIAHVPIVALSGVTAWMGLCLLDWSAWRRLPKMRRLDAAGFLITAASVLAVNAALAVGIGVSLYALHALYERMFRYQPPRIADLQVR
jgi:sulfate permease, SulP family